MSAHFEYKEVVGISHVNIEEAIKEAVSAVAKTHKVGWFELVSLRGRPLEDGELEYQVTVKTGCKAK